MTTESKGGQAKPTKYYIDFENVHGAGLKGVDALTERDEVIIIYSQAAETFHIEHAIDILKSNARIQFVEADAGTRNAADFQLIVALYANMDEAYDYAIISGDGGFDAAIKMGERMGKPAVRRLANIAGDEAEPEKPKSRRSRRSRSGRDAAKETSSEAAPAEPPVEEQAATEASADEVAAAGSGAPASTEEPAQTAEAQESEQASDKKPSSSRRRPRRRKRASSSEDQGDAQVEAVQTQDGPASAPEETGDVTGARDAGAEGVAAFAGEAVTSAEVASDKGDVAPEEAQPQADTADEANAAKKSRKRSSKRTSTRKETDDAYARAAEAMRLASQGASARDTAATGDAATAKKPQTETAPATSDVDAAAAQGVSALVKDLLEQKGVQLSDAQIATVASALDGPDGRQGFYRRIIKIERQQNGRALYRQVREHYEALLQAIEK